MRYPLGFVLSFTIVLFFFACAPPPTHQPGSDQQPASPLAVTTVAAQITKAIPPTVTVLATDLWGNGYIQHFVWQGDSLITQYSAAQPQDRLKFSPGAEIWQRNQISVDDLRVGVYARLFGSRTGSHANVDYIILPAADTTRNFVPTIEYSPELIAEGEVEAIKAEGNDVFTIQLRGNPLHINFYLVTRIFTEERAAIDTLEEKSLIQYRGDLLQDAVGTLVEVKQAVVVERPSDYRVTTYPLQCHDAGVFTHCHDQYLGIEFEHPASWGAGVGQLERSRYAGYSYNYSFENPKVIAGGRSNPFGEPRGGMPTDFLGFGGHTAEELCAYSYADLCEVMQPGVVLIIQIPTGVELCAPGPGVIWGPHAIVKVDLPKHDTINGLIFATEFVSERLTQELGLIKPGSSNTSSLYCDEADQHHFDQLMQQLGKEIRDGTVEVQTQINLDALRTMARSFQGESLPR
ncbi:MAG: hypothetical protein DYG89_14410 [Caldilinea sp. CFX5]|nr:hypothetical protein [Caldilinea sp. CFX5]